MRSVVITTALTLVAITASSGLPSLAESATPTTRTVIGRVTDAGTRAGLAEVLIVVPDQRLGTKSADSGSFTLTDVPTGVVSVELRHPCFFTTQVVIPATGNIELELGLPFDRSSLQRPGCGGLGASRR